MSTLNLKHELRVARDLARNAGRVILEVYATEFSVQDKGGGEGPVTEADRRANELIVRTLRDAFPRDGIIAEESKDNSDASCFERCWFIDPVDGTKEFVNRNGEFAVHIGLAIGGVATLGVVYRPVDDRLYSGAIGGSCVLEHGGASRELRVTSVAEPEKLRLLVSRSNKSRRTDEIRRKLGITQVIESGSVGVKCGLLAEGAADVYIHSSPKSSRWDACAPEAVLAAAGGRLSDLWGAPYRYDGTELQNVRGILGCNAAAHERVLEAVRSVLGATPPP